MNIEDIRKDFSYLDEKKIGKKIIYLDNAATSQRPDYVLNEINDFYKYKNANPHRGAHYLGYLSTELYESSREKIASFINAHSDEIVFTKNATESLNLIAYSYALNKLNSGDEIVISILEHHANLVPWQFVAKKTGAILKYVYLNDDYSLNYKQLEEKITNKTKIVSITGTSNVTGEVIDVKYISKLAHDVGAISIVDASQLIPHKKVDVLDINCDFLVFSGHKMLSPLGIGVIYGKRELLDSMNVFIMGGDMIEYVYEQYSTFEKAPNKFEAGTQNVGGVIGLKSAIDYIEKIGIEQINKYENELCSYAYDLIKDIDNIKIYYPKNKKTSSVLSFSFSDIHAHDVATILDSYGIAVRSGHHCAMPLHKYLNVSATCRASFSFYNTKEEVKFFSKKLRDMRKVMGL